MSIFLIGYRGSGKSTVGRKLADRLWQTFVDSDELVVRQAGKTIKEMFESGQEPLFRDIEAKVVADLAMLDDHVISLGGGTLMREENRVAIQKAGHKVIYLRCEPEELHRRIQADPRTAETRPSLTKLGGNLEEIRNLLAIREPVYRQTMTAELDVTHLTPEEACVYITRML